MTVASIIQGLNFIVRALDRDVSAQVGAGIAVQRQESTVGEFSK